MLVVEDEPDLREYLRELLSPAYEVLTAANGQAALELLARVQLLLARQQVRRHFAALPADAPDELAAAPVGAPVGALTAAATPATLAAAETAAAEAPAPSTGASERLAQWQARVANHLANEQVGPPELAHLLGISERTLYRRLGELAGLTPAAWRRELRLHQARQRLEAGDFGSVAQVADAVGFASAKHFSTLYAERFGRRPSEYGVDRE